VTADLPRYPPRVRILYEDSRSATNGFGLHEFVLANTCDVMLGRGGEIERYRLAKLIEAIPMKSDTKVLRAIPVSGEAPIGVPWEAPTRSTPTGLPRAQRDHGSSASPQTQVGRSPLQRTSCDGCVARNP
jgi:hypothetical protein